MAERADGPYWCLYQEQWTIWDWGMELYPNTDESKKGWLSAGSARRMGLQDEHFDEIDERPVTYQRSEWLRHEERTAVWTKGKKAPVLKFDNFDFDILTVRLEGDTTEAFRFTVKEVRRFAREHQAPHHFTLKVAPNLNSLFRLETP